MPVLIIAVVFFLLFLLMGVMLSSAMLVEHGINRTTEHPVAGGSKR